MFVLMIVLFVMLEVGCEEKGPAAIDVVDLTHPTTIPMIADYYGAVDKNWKLCVNCGVPGLGTTMHLEHEASSSQAVYPAVIPTEYLITRLVVVDVSALARLQRALVLAAHVALQWRALRADPPEPTLLLFRFGTPAPPAPPAARAVICSCVCKVPGISLELAEWIAANLTHVVGVATDAATLESEHTRQLGARSVAAVLARAGVYIIENVNIRKKLPERGCMALAMPLKLQHAGYVPARLTALCPAPPAALSPAPSPAGGEGGRGRWCWRCTPRARRPAPPAPARRTSTSTTYSTTDAIPATR